MFFKSVMQTCTFLSRRSPHLRVNLSGTQTLEIQEVAVNIQANPSSHSLFPLCLSPLKASVHLPRIGHSTKGFNWYGTERLIRKHLASRGIPTFMYPLTLSADLSQESYLSKSLDSILLNVTLTDTITAELPRTLLHLNHPPLPPWHRHPALNPSCVTPTGWLVKQKQTLRAPQLLLGAPAPQISPVSCRESMCFSTTSLHPRERGWPVTFSHILSDRMFSTVCSHSQNVKCKSRRHVYVGFCGEGRVTSEIESVVITI